MKNIEKSLELDAYIPCQLVTLSNNINRSVASLFEEWFEISIPEWKVMGVVMKMPGMSAVDVASHANLDTVAVSRAVTKLMDANYMLREFGKEDRRRSMLELTQTGKELYARITPLAESLQSSLLQGLTDEERAVFEKALKTLIITSRDFAQQFETKSPRIKPAERPNSRIHKNKDRGSRLATSLMARFTSGMPALR